MVFRTRLAGQRNTERNQTVNQKALSSKPVCGANSFHYRVPPHFRLTAHCATLREWPISRDFGSPKRMARASEQAELAPRRCGTARFLTFSEHWCAFG